MAKIREYDSPSDIKVKTRSDRVFSEQELWYFKTREENEVGPFRYRCEAESNLDKFMTQLENTIK